MINKTIKLETDYWSEQFLRTFKSSPHYKTALLYQEGVNIEYKDTPHYLWLNSILKNEGHVWGNIIETEEDILNQCKNFKIMFDIAPNWKKLYEGVQEKDGNYFGEFPCIIDGKGHLELTDGRHRFAILLAKKLQLPNLILCNRSEEWQEMYNNVQELYPDKHLYQPILHPDFQDYNQGRLTEKEDIIISLFKEYKIKNVIDLGSCHGYTLYRLRDIILHGMGIEYDEKRYYVTKTLLKNFKNIQIFNQDIGNYLSESKEKVDCILALAILHHYIRQNTLDNILKLLDNIKNKCNYFIYELPDKSENSYLWLSNILGDIHTFIQSRLEFQEIAQYKYNIRTIYILRKSQ
jgi:hypothetical protein